MEMPFLCVCVYILFEPRGHAFIRHALISVTAQWEDQVKSIRHSEIYKPALTGLSHGRQQAQWEQLLWDFRKILIWCNLY